MLNSYKDLIVWQKAMDLAEEVYLLSKRFPKEEQFAFTYQIRRAVVSVPSKIAEGKGRTSKAEYLHFLSVANGSLSEVDTQLLLAVRIGYLDQHQVTEALNLREEVSRMLAALRTKLQDSTP